MFTKSRLKIVGFFAVLLSAPDLAAQDDYRLGAGDMIQIEVFGVEDFSFKRRISSNGLIRLPHVGEILAAGLTGEELERQLTSKLEGRLIRSPQVSVHVDEYEAQSCVVLGAVKNPGVYKLSRELRLLDVIAVAGGFKAESNVTEASIYRQNATLPRDLYAGNLQAGMAAAVEPYLYDKSALRKVNFRELLDHGSMELNLPIHGGDVVYIQEEPPDRFYVIGEVVSPGGFNLPRGEKLLVSQALSLAGGPLRTAKSEKGVIVRYFPDGTREDTPLNFDEILKGEKADFLIQPGDIIFIPGSTIKSIGYGLLGILPFVASQTAVSRVQ